MRILKSKSFCRWASEADLKDAELLQAVQEMQQGIYDANLGGNIYKKRVRLKNRGKRGGARTIVAFKSQIKTIFLYGFAKNTRANITKKEEETLKALAKVYFRYDDHQIGQAIKLGELIEVQL